MKILLYPCRPSHLLFWPVNTYNLQHPNCHWIYLMASVSLKSLKQRNKFQILSFDYLLVRKCSPYNFFLTIKPKYGHFIRLNGVVGFYRRQILCGKGLPEATPPLTFYYCVRQTWEVIYCWRFWKEKMECWGDHFLICYAHGLGGTTPYPKCS